MKFKLNYDGKNFNPPTPEEIRDYMKEHNLTGSKLAAITGVSSRQVRRWTSQKGEKSHQNIPMSAWVLALLYFNGIEITEYRELIQKYFISLISDS